MSGLCNVQRPVGGVHLYGNQDIYGSKSFFDVIHASGGITNVPTPMKDTDVANKAYVDGNAFNVGRGLLRDSNDDVNIDETVVVTTDTSQTITGSKTFSAAIQALAGISGLPAPTQDSEATNKQYVDLQDPIAGTGITVNGSEGRTVNISNGGVTTALLGDAAVTSAKVTTSGSSGVAILQGAQTYTGAKTFEDLVSLSTYPTNDEHAAHKKYVDDQKLTAGESIVINQQNEIMVPDSGITEDKINNGAITTDKIGAAAVNSSKVRTDSTSGIMTLGHIQDVYGVKTFKEEANFEGPVDVSSVMSCSKSSGTGLSVTSNTELKGDVQINGHIKLETSGLGGTGYVGFKGSSQIGDAKMFTLPGLLDTENQSTLRFYETVSGAADTYFAHPVYKRYVKSTDQYVTANTIVTFGTEYGSTTTQILKNSSNKFVFQPHRTYKIDINLLMYVPYTVNGTARVSVGWTNTYTAGTGTPVNGQVVTFINPDRQSTANTSSGSITVYGENRYYNGSISTVLTTGSGAETWWLQGMSASLAGATLLGENFSNTSGSALFSGGSQITILAL
jgi:hypothetical protein